MSGQPIIPLSRGAGRRMARAILLAVAWLASWAGTSLPSAAEGYLLAPQDQIRLKVYEWRASRDQIFEWSALNDQFTVGPDGTLSLPLAGAIRAEGRTIGQLEQAIGESLKQRLGLGIRPDTTVEIVQYRPFYISGQVAKPGEYPFRPNLSVLQAVSIAGGLRTDTQNLSRIEREIISGQGEVGVLALKEISLLARKARLESELADGDHVTFPQELTRGKAEPAVAVVMDQEKEIFRSRREALNTQIRALKNLKVTLKQEVASLKGQLEFQDKQVELIRKELTSVSSLVEKGLAAAPREMSLERELAQYQSGRLAARTSLLRARQEINRTDISISEQHNSYNKEVTANLRQTQSQLDELRRQKQTANQLLSESRLLVPRLLARRAGGGEVEPTYTIVRSTPEGEKTISATQGTPVQPGDTIKVEFPPVFDTNIINGPSAGPQFEEPSDVPAGPGATAAAGAAN